MPIDESLQIYDDAVVYNRGIIAHFRNRQGGSFTIYQEYMADCVNASADFGNRSGDLHGWLDLSPSSGAFATVYQSYYSTLKNVNFTIEKYPQLRTEMEALMASAPENEQKEIRQQLAMLDQFEGNAHFARAYYYFNLLLRYSTPYSPKTETTALGVPMVTEFDVSSQVKRNTVKECYDQIFSDLKVAETALQNVPCKPNSYSFSKDCVTALEARIALERKEYDKAYTYAMKLIESGTYPLVAPTRDAFEQMWVYDTSSEDILNIFISNPDEQPNTMGYYWGFSRNTGYHTPDFYPTKGLIDKYGPTDLRKDVYFYRAPFAKIGDVVYENEVMLIQKFKGNPEYATVIDEKYGVMYNGLHRLKVFRIAEQYLIAAEAAYFSGKDALKPLNALRISRGIEPISLSGDPLLKEIQDERVRELCFEGFRLWDLRRWGLPMTRLAPQELPSASAFTDYLAPDYYELSVMPSDPLYRCMVWPIPQRDINVYGAENLPQNPGW